MNLAVPAARSRLVTFVIAVLLAAAALAYGLWHSSTAAIADLNPNNTTCEGYLQKGEPEPGDPGATQVEYVFGCSGPITGYQVQPDKAVQSLETEVFATDRTSGNVVSTDAFSCNGDIPGFGVNCVGTYGGFGRWVKGQFSIAGKLCAEPRVDALLTVVYAYKDAAGKVQQAIAGPFELGRPHGCPRSLRAGKTRMPKSSDTPADY